MRMVELQGIELQVVRQGTGPHLLLLHGGDGPQDQLPFFNRLSERFDVIAPVHPGFAGSDIPMHLDTIDDLVYLCWATGMALLSLPTVIQIGGWGC